MPRREFSRKTKRDAFVRAGGRCEMVLPSGERCPCKLQTGRFTYDHRQPDFMLGEPTLENCQVICTPCDKAKYATDRATIDKTRRQSDAHMGATKPRAKMQGARLPAGQPALRATTPLVKPMPPRRSLFVSTERTR